jgi:hypothetical protein
MMPRGEVHGSTVEERGTVAAGPEKHNEARVAVPGYSARAAKRASNQERGAAMAATT